MDIRYNLFSSYSPNKKRKYNKKSAETNKDDEAICDDSKNNDVTDSVDNDIDCSFNNDIDNSLNNDITYSFINDNVILIDSSDSNSSDGIIVLESSSDSEIIQESFARNDGETFLNSFNNYEFLNFMDYERFGIHSQPHTSLYTKRNIVVNNFITDGKWITRDKDISILSNSIFKSFIDYHHHRKNIRERNFNLSKENISSHLKKYYQAIIKFCDMIRIIEGISIKDIKVDHIVDITRVLNFIILNHKIYSSFSTIRTIISSFLSFIIYIENNDFVINKSLEFNLNYSKNLLSLDSCSLLKKMRSKSKNIDNLSISMEDINEIFNSLFGKLNILINDIKNRDDSKSYIYFKFQSHLIPFILLVIGGQRLQVTRCIKENDIKLDIHKMKYFINISENEKKSRENPSFLYLPLFMTRIMKQFLEVRKSFLSVKSIEGGYLFFNRNFNHLSIQEVSRTFSKAAKSIVNVKNITPQKLRRSIPTLAISNLKDINLMSDFRTKLYKIMNTSEEMLTYNYVIRSNNNDINSIIMISFYRFLNHPLLNHYRKELSKVTNCDYISTIDGIERIESEFDIYRVLKVKSKKVVDDTIYFLIETIDNEEFYLNIINFKKRIHLIEELLAT